MLPVLDHLYIFASLKAYRFRIPLFSMEVCHVRSIRFITRIKSMTFLFIVSIIIVRAYQLSTKDLEVIVIENVKFPGFLVDDESSHAN